MNIDSACFAQAGHAMAGCTRMPFRPRLSMEGWRDMPYRRTHPARAYICGLDLLFDHPPLSV